MTIVEAPTARRTEPAPDPTTGQLVGVRGLTVSYPGNLDHPAVADVSFHIERGKRVALVGESGSGKTTLAMAIAGFLPPAAVITADTLTFDGAELQGRRRRRIPQRTPGISMIFQDAMTSLDPVWTVGSQLTSLVRSTTAVSRRQAADDARSWLTRVGLTDTHRVMKARPYELSGGMRQRVMMALALCSSPSLLIADEPTSALDASLSRGVMDLIVELTESCGTSLLIVTHDLTLSLEFADEIMVMYRGRLVERQAASTIAEHPSHPYTKGLLACIPTLDSVDTRRLPTLADFLEPGVNR